MYKTGSSDKLTEQEVMNCWGQPPFCLVDNTTMFVMTIIVITMKMMMSQSLQRVTAVKNGRESHKACFVNTNMAEKPIIVYLSVSCYCDCDEEDRT